MTLMFKQYSGLFTVFVNDSIFAMLSLTIENNLICHQPQHLSISVMLELILIFIFISWDDGKHYFL